MTTPNTNPSDLDREALEPCPFCGGNAIYSFNSYVGDMSMASCEQCGAGVFWKKWQKRALPRASGVPEAEAIRELMALKEWAVAIVQSVRPPTTRLWDEKDAIADATLCDAILAIRNAESPLVAAPSGEAVEWQLVPKQATQEMVDAAQMTHTSDLCDADVEDIYETMLRNVPPSPIASEPKDARLSRAATFKAAYNIALTNDFPDWLSAFQASEEPWGELGAGSEDAIEALQKCACVYADTGEFDPHGTLEQLDALGYRLVRGKSEEAQELTRQQQIVALHIADMTKLRQEHAKKVIDRLYGMGFAITRTAPSGARPGEVKP